MTKSELIDKIYREFRQPGTNNFTYAKADAAVDAIFEDITEALAHGKRVELRGFGAFSVRRYDARKGHNPLTLEKQDIPETHRVYFRNAKAISIRILGRDAG